ncbi:hypothetical protein GCM10010532_033220 [Dactylosporangium siamense]|uniref:DUF4304 domain-containing protein n=2 Tax=Dactylosporangium siamense TaxID=685454 RepID=A0A919PKK8_9ACTN|nr:hypothetical protein Dsi01nite_017690 [Dactylosporangium siamense]
MLRESVGPVLREAGFTGTAPTWRLLSGRGDFAVVQLASSRWNTADEVRFEVNLALVPQPWWRFSTRFLLDRAPRTPRFHDGLFDKQCHPERRCAGRRHPVLGRDGWVVRDAASADVCAEVLRAELTTVVIPELVALQHRGTLIATLRAEAQDWGVAVWHRLPRKVAIALLMLDEGPGPELAEAINIVRSLPADRVAARDALLDLLIRAQTQASTIIP